MVEDKSLPIIALKFSFKGAGSIHDGIEKQGLAQLLSNTMDEGAGDIKSQEFQKILSDNSITLNFSAGRDNFGGQLKTLSRHKDIAFNLLKLSLTQPRFDEEPLERMRQANLARIRSSMGDPDWITARLMNDKAFEGRPYALNSGGTLESLPKITAKDLQSHVTNWLTQDRLMIGVMGDINKDDLVKLLDDVFGSLPPKGSTDNLSSFEIQNTGKIYLYPQEIPQTIISLALPSIDVHDPDYYALQVMNYIFGAGGFGSRLMEEIREKRGLTYGIYSDTTNLDYTDFFTINTSTKNNSVKQVLDIIISETDTIKTQKVSQEDLSNSKSYLIGSLPMSLTSTDKISSILLSLQLNNRPINYLDTYATNINTVTNEDILRVAKRIFNPEKMISVLVGKPEHIENTIKIETLPNVQ
ncbi:MAG TPA: pitrilysin family protein [Alphaproteobacteria bacterium]|nr:pitrilysin family protein [Alphaproteobacteria bacterium]